MSILTKYKPWVLITISCFLYVYLGYFLERTQFYTLLTLWLGLFGCYGILLKKTALTFKNLIGLVVLFRLILLFSTPNLSQDFYRFIWDGRLLLEGINPYLSTPASFVDKGQFPISQAKELIRGMGSLSAGHYTNYPPLHQAAFWLSSIFGSQSILGSIIGMRVLIILADLGILFVGSKLLGLLKLPKHLIFWYSLNPFIIIEYTGNLHFEPLMLFFLITSIYLLFKNKWLWSSVAMACAVSVKLIPLLFIPLLYQWFVKRALLTKEGLRGLLKLSTYTLILLLVNLILFAPFLSATMQQNYSDSVGLWFRVFEFNPSFYYIFREIGYLFRGYNEIAIIGKIIPILTIVFLISISLFRKNNSPKQLITAFLFGLSFYYFTSTTIHPWYLGTLLLLSIFTKYRFPLIWTCVIILSYAAYSYVPYRENPWWLLLEYSIVYGTLCYELFVKPKHNKTIS